MTIDYANLSKEDLLKRIAELERVKNYGLIWEERGEKIVDKCQSYLPVLIGDKEKKLITDKNEPVNIMIEGDNYIALSILNYTHSSKIDVVYIDPPYNTGNKDFVYNDLYVEKEDTYRHSKYLSFMSHRLGLVRALLNERGVLFISIDDKEVSQLKLLCDSIFGENNVELYIWSLFNSSEGSFVKTPQNTVRKEHEYIIACFKNKKLIKFNKYEEYRYLGNRGFTNPDNDSRKNWMSGNISRTGIKTTTGAKYYEIVTPTGRKYTRNWTVSKDEYEELLKDGRIYFANNGNGVPRLKIFQDEPQLNTQSSIFGGLGSSITGKNQLKEIFGYSPFNFPKPTTLIKRLVAIASQNTNAIILDFFAGSGTTGQAILELNSKDAGHRRFILCTNNENGIAEEICYPRIKKIVEGCDDRPPTRGNLRYFKTDFIHKTNVSDDVKYALVDRSTEMICLKEDCFEEVINEKHIKIFTNNDYYTAILFHLDQFEEFKKKLRGLDKPIHVYVFSLTNDTYEDDFMDLPQEHTLCPISESILEVYRKIFKE